MFHRAAAQPSSNSSLDLNPAPGGSVHGGQKSAITDTTIAAAKPATVIAKLIWTPALDSTPSNGDAARTTAPPSTVAIAQLTVRVVESWFSALSRRFR